jgi:hypothetical protein
MHQQIRTKPALSPADLQAFLALLAGAGINLESAGGSNIEGGGEFAFAVAHGQEDEAIALLRQAGYRPRLVDVDWCYVTNDVGQLLECIAGVTKTNTRAGKVIKEIALGVPEAPGEPMRVQIYSE